MDQYIDDKEWEIFDSFCKQVIKNAGRNIRRRYLRQLQNESLMGFPEDNCETKYAAYDSYPSEGDYIEFNGALFSVKKSWLLIILEQLPPKQLGVLIYGYWCGQTDEQIAATYRITTRTVQNLRARAFEKIRRYRQNV